LSHTFGIHTTDLSCAEADLYMVLPSGVGGDILLLPVRVLHVENGRHENSFKAGRVVT